MTSEQTQQYCYEGTKLIEPRKNKLMTINNEIPSLKVVPIENLHLHEINDEHRTSRLSEKIYHDGVMRNPLIVTPLRDRKKHYVVLDGANRFSAFRKLGIWHILVQIVEPDDPNLKLHSWSHVLRGNATDLMVERIQNYTNLKWEWVDEVLASQYFNYKQTLVRVFKAEGKFFSVTPIGGETNGRVDQLNTIVDSYINGAPTERTILRTLEPVEGHNPEVRGLVVFPCFTIEEILRLAATGQRLPAGVTRFSISPRALHLNYPLSELAADKPLVEKNTLLKGTVQEKIASGGVRIYTEATIIFDE